MSHPYRPGAQRPHHMEKTEEVYRQNPKTENQQQEAMVNEWILDMAQHAGIQGHEGGCHAKYEELKRHRVEVVQYLSAMRGWAMETTKTIRQLEKRTRIAEKEAAASKAEVLRLQEILSKKMGHSDGVTSKVPQKKRKKKKCDDNDDSHASSVQQ